MMLLLLLMMMKKKIMTAVCLQLSAGEVGGRSDVVVGLDGMVAAAILELSLVRLQQSLCCDMHETSCVVCKPHP